MFVLGILGFIAAMMIPFMMGIQGIRG